jgi:dTDP-glucose pyrophosphorylase
MKHWEKILVDPNISIRQALQVIDKMGSNFVLVVDNQRKILGSLSDGDARRAILGGLTLSDPVHSAMNPAPKSVSVNRERLFRTNMIRKLGLQYLPIIQDDGSIVGVELANEQISSVTRHESVVVMAGGRGVRLNELTKDVPKPMLKVGPRPLLETIIRSLSVQGFSKFYLAVNYKANIIESHFGDGARFGIEVRYLREEEPLGTAGALSLIPEPLKSDLLVINADLLVNEDFGGMIDYHVANKSHATIGVKEYEIQIPFGVIRQNNSLVFGIDEKPVHSVLVSAGVSVLSPEIVDLVPKNCFYNMTDLFDSVIKSGMSLRSYRIDGCWLDIGRPADYQTANELFEKEFS